MKQYRKHNNILIVLVLCMIAITTNAEDRRLYRYEFVVGGGINNFMGDIAAPQNSSIPFWTIGGNTTNFFANVGIKYNLGKRDECDRLKLSTQSVGVMLRMGEMNAEDPIDKNNFWNRNIGFNSFYTELTLRYEWYFIPEKPSRYVFKQVGKPKRKSPTRTPSYLFGSIGGILNIGEFYYQYKKNDERNKKQYVNLAPILQFGIGTKFRMQRGVSLGLETGWCWAINDELDNSNGKKEPTTEKPWIYGEYIDQYQFIAISVGFKLRETKKHLPDFKSIWK